MMRVLKKTLILMFLLGLASGASAYSGGSGSSSNPYIIASYADLSQLSSEVSSSDGRYYALSGDIQMTRYHDWSPIGTEGSPFMGHFDGRGNTIYVNFSGSNASLFGVISSDPKTYAVRSLDVEGSVRSDTNAAGIVVSLDNGLIENCRFSGRISVNDSELYEPNEYLKAGGIAAYMSAGKLRRCSFNGELETNGGIYLRSGGIVAWMQGGDLENCSVSHYSAVSAYSSNEDSSAIAGGIAGQVNIELDESISGCVFRGEVLAEADGTSYAGGIVGHMRGGTLSNNTVLDDSLISGGYTAGGIAGYLGTGGTADNNTVHAGATVSADSLSAGGIVGILELGKVTDNTSHAMIRGNAQYKGGIIGEVSPATEEPATSDISGNEYSGADYGIGRDSSGYPSNDPEKTYKVNPPFYVRTDSRLPDAKVNIPYTQTFSASEAGSEWTKTGGDFPEGLTLEPNGILHGTPSVAGTYTFTLRASMTASNRSAEKSFELTVNPALMIVTSSDLPDGKAGEPYTAPLATDSENPASVMWSSSTLPSGLNIGTLTGTISGIPLLADYYTFTVEARSGNYIASKDFTLLILPSLRIITDSELPAATLNTEYIMPLSTDASDTESITWSSNNLPEWLALDESGTLSGTPDRTGTFSFTVYASISGDLFTASKDFTLTVEQSLMITTASPLPDARRGVSYDVLLEAAMDSDLLMTWSIVSGDFPDGLTLRANTGEISGTPTREGTYMFAIQVMTGGLTAQKTFMLTVRPAFSITTDSELPDATPGRSYLLILENDADDLDVVAYSLTEGKLPDGLSFDAQTGSISGIPSDEGIFTFTIEADVRSPGRSLTTRKVFTLAVRSPMSILTSGIHALNAGSFFTLRLETDSGSASWDVVSGDVPLGLSLSESGTLSGIPARAGVFTFTVQALSGYSLARKDFTLTVNLVISQSSYLPDATVGRSYSYLLTAEGANADSVVWSLVPSSDIVPSSDLKPNNYALNLMPPGLTLNAQGLIQGIPSTEGIYDFTVKVSADELSARATLRITIGTSENVPIPITTASLDKGRVNEEYYAVLSSTVSGVTWTISEDRLPIGLELSTYGVISGVPLESRSFDFTVRASLGAREGGRRLTLEIEPPKEEEPVHGVSSSGGGCDSGFGFMSMFVLTLAFSRRRR